MRLVLAILGVMLVLGCAPEIVEEPFEPVTSHQDYREALVFIDLHETELGRAWISASDASLGEPMVVEPPFEELLFLDPRDPAAVGYEFAVQQGRAVTITIDTDMERYFADLFRVEEGPELTMVASRPDDLVEIRFEARRDGRYLLRVQPELLRGGRVTVRIVAAASLAFPVEGVGPEAVLSFFGDGRDAGLRVHEGIDIFGPRGTRLLAATDAVVSRVGVRDRGGNIVSLHDEERNLMLYYAHLEEQLVEQGQRVQAGDVIGTMGNTGNAIWTPPHLHIGVYQGNWRGAVDPWNYFVDPPLTEPPPVHHGELAGTWQRLERSAPLYVAVAAPAATPRYVNRNPFLRREGAGESRSVIDRYEVEPVPPGRDPNTGWMVDGDTPLFVLGAAGGYLRVRTPDGREGYVESEVISRRVEQVSIGGDVMLRDPRTADAFAVLPAEESVTRLGVAGGRMYVRTQTGRVGFLDG